MQSWLTTTYPDLWLLFLGALFMGVVLLCPDGVVGTLRRALVWGRSRSRALRTGVAVAGAPPSRGLAR